MSEKRPFRFGGGLFWADSAADWADGARRLESLGYDTLVIGDHFSREFAPIPALLAAASATSRLRVGCTVFDNDFRHPAALAKEAATLDVLSGGRFEFGIGAGWNKPEYNRVGMTFDSPALRVSRFEEAIQLLTSSGGGAATLASAYEAYSAFLENQGEAGRALEMLKNARGLPAGSARGSVPTVPIHQGAK